MSNEELAAAIKAGNTELYSDLWGQVQRFVVMKARQRYILTNGVGGVEIEDLVQSGFLALVSAVHYFDPASGVSFLAVLGNCLKTAFSTAGAAGGYRTRKQNPLDMCSSLNAPLDDEKDGETLLDRIEEPRDYIEEQEEKIWRDDLRAVLEKEVSALPLEQMETIYRRFCLQETKTAVAAAVMATPETVRKWEGKALQRLRGKREIGRYVDENTLFYTHIGVSCFQRTHTSAVELLVQKRESMVEALTDRKSVPFI